MRSRATAWAAYAACALTLLYAAPRFYWALSGTAGLHSVGGPTEALGRSGSVLRACYESRSAIEGREYEDNSRQSRLNAQEPGFSQAVMVEDAKKIVCIGSRTGRC
jgi:hypothetical protein